MPDREKVIKGLECCASMNGSACRECPYSSECIASEATYQTGTAHLAADALAVLKEQEAVEPKQVDLYVREDWWGLVCVCPDCKVEWISNEAHTHYCPNCGKPVKWG